tara:strand:- start:1987 stop:2457 length:471 start_codon:yes stop_codon:yes gene_type:complete
MKIFIDADACPKVIKKILYRAANRAQVELVLIANKVLSIPSSNWIKSIQVSSGFDIADNYIIEQVNSGDLVVTCDIPLAAEVIEKGAQVINHRGEKYNRNNIRPRLNMRDFMEGLRSSGEITGGPPPLNYPDRQAFANVLDQILTKLKKDSSNKHE